MLYYKFKQFTSQKIIPGRNLDVRIWRLDESLSSSTSGLDISG